MEWGIGCRELGIRQEAKRRLLSARRREDMLSSPCAEGILPRPPNTQHPQHPQPMKNIVTYIALAFLALAPSLVAQDVTFGGSSLGEDGVKPILPVVPKNRTRTVTNQPEIRFFDPATLPLDTADGLPQSPTYLQAINGLMERMARGTTVGIGTARNQADMGPLRYEHLLRCPTATGSRFFIWKGVADSGPDYGNMVSPAPLQIVSPAGVTVIPSQVTVTVEGFRWNGSVWISIGVLRNVTLSTLGDARWVTTAGVNGIPGDGDDIKLTIQDPNAPAQIISYGGPSVNVVVSSANSIPSTLNTLRNGAYTFRVMVTVPYSFNGVPQTPLVRYKDVKGIVDMGGAQLCPGAEGSWQLDRSISGLTYLFQKSGDLQSWTTASSFSGNGGMVNLGTIMSGDMVTVGRTFYRVIWRGDALPEVPPPNSNT